MINFQHSHGDYRPYPKCISAVVDKWLKSPNIEKSMRADKTNPEYVERQQQATLFASVYKYKNLGYITTGCVEQLAEFAVNCDKKRAVAIEILKAAPARFEGNVHAAIDVEWRNALWKALYIMRDQIPEELYKTAKKLITRRAMLSTGCPSLVAALKNVADIAFKEVFGLSEEPLFQEWLSLCMTGDCTWVPIENIEYTHKVETGYDLTVPGYQTFVASTGIVLSNTVNIHVPISDAARE